MVDSGKAVFLNLDSRKSQSSSACNQQRISTQRNPIQELGVTPSLDGSKPVVDGEFGAVELCARGFLATTKETTTDESPKNDCSMKLPQIAEMASDSRKGCEHVCSYSLSSISSISSNDDASSSFSPSASSSVIMDVGSVSNVLLDAPQEDQDEREIYKPKEHQAWDL